MVNRLLNVLAVIGETVITRPAKVAAKVQISQAKFRVKLDLKGWAMDEIRVKAHPEYLLIEGKHEQDIDQGTRIVQFTKKFRLPKGCMTNKIRSKFSPDGVLTINAKRSHCNDDACNTVLIPIESESLVRGRRTKDEDLPCRRYPKVKRGTTLQWKSDFITIAYVTIFNASGTFSSNALNTTGTVARNDSRAYICQTLAFFLTRNKNTLKITPLNKSIVHKMSLHSYLFDYDHPRWPRRLLDQNFGLTLTPADLLAAPVSPIVPRIKPWWPRDAGSSIKTDKDKWQINVDVQHFAPDEITVKTTNGFIIVEGKHEEKQDEHGFVSRQFVRRFKLPENSNPDAVESKLSSDGVLTVVAPNKAEDVKGERTVPITQTGPARQLVDEAK